jgi:hypothetical protein
MIVQIEDVDEALPYGLTRVNLFDRQCVDQHGRSAVLAFHGLFDLVGANFHCCI